MAISERFGFGLNVIVGIHAIPFQNITNLEVLGVRILPTNLDSERNIIIDLGINSDTFEVRAVFRDETLTAQTLTGQRKQHMEAL